MYAEEPFGVDLAETVYALDATTIDLCLSVFLYSSKCPLDQLLAPTHPNENPVDARNQLNLFD